MKISKAGSASATGSSLYDLISGVCARCALLARANHVNLGHSKPNNVTLLCSAIISCWSSTPVSTIPQLRLTAGTINISATATASMRLYPPAPQAPLQNDASLQKPPGSRASKGLTQSRLTAVPVHRTRSFSRAESLCKGHAAPGEMLACAVGCQCRRNVVMQTLQRCS